MVPKLYNIAHPRTPYLVIYTDHHGKRRRKHFKLKKDADEYLANLSKRMAYEGTAGLAMDAESRSEFYGARRVLLEGGHDGVSLVEVARFFVAAKPGRVADKVDALEAAERFIEERRRENLSLRTIENLDRRIRGFLNGCRVSRLGDVGAGLVRDWVYRRGVSPRTSINDRAALMRFFRWAKRAGLVGFDPVEAVDKPRADDPPPEVFSVEPAKILMRAAEEYREGRFARYFAIALFAGLRPSEIEQLGEDAWTPGAKVIRVRGGKLRGRANRFAPVTENLKAWLRAYPNSPFYPKPFRLGFRRVRELAGDMLAKERGIELVKDEHHPFPWQEDICRHSFISYRLAQVGDEVRVAREAGNSPEIIYRDYFQLRTKGEARRFFGIRPGGKGNPSGSGGFERGKNCGRDGQWAGGALRA